MFNGNPCTKLEIRHLKPDPLSDKAFFVHSDTVKSAFDMTLTAPILAKLCSSILHDSVPLTGARQFKK